MAVINPHDPNKILDLEWTFSLARFRLEFAAAAGTKSWAKIIAGDALG